MSRIFEDKPATREKVPLFIGLFGPSGSGKTYSALELATGIQSVTGGDIHVIDTEARRALHYADRFTFRHVQFDAPFASLDYVGSIIAGATRPEQVTANAAAASSWRLSAEELAEVDRLTK